MGNCSCLHAKNEPIEEIDSERFINAKPIQEQCDNLTDNYDKDIPISLGTNIPGDDTGFSLISLIQTQALFRRCIAQHNMQKKSISLSTEPTAIPEDALSLITAEAKQAYISLGPLVLEGDLQVKIGRPATALSDGSIYIGE